MRRRELLQAVAGLTFSGPLSGEELEPNAALLVRRSPDEKSAVVLSTSSDWFVPTTFTGIRGRYLQPRGDCEPLLWLEFGSRDAKIHFPGEERPCRVGLATGGDYFAASWALPVIGAGTLTGFDPSRDLSPFAAPPYRAEFHAVPDVPQARLPTRALAASRAVFMTYLGEGLTVQRLDAVAQAISAHLPGDAHFNFTATETPGHAPQVLLTIFDR